MIELIAFLGSYFFYCFFSLGAAQMFIDGEGLGFMIAVFFLIPAGIAFGVTSWKSCLNLLGEQVPKGLKVLITVILLLLPSIFLLPYFIYGNI